MPTPSRHLATIRAEIGSRGRRLLVLAGVAVPGHDGDDPVGGGALRGVDHRQQLDQGVVGRHPALLVGAGRLDDEDVGAADRLLVAAVDLAVGEGLQRHLAEVDVELVGDAGGELHRAAAAEDHHPLRVVVADRGRGGRHRLRVSLLDRAHSSSSSRISPAFSIGVALDVPLVVVAHRKCPFGNVALHHCTGASVGPVPDLYRGDQHRVNADADLVADHRPVLAETVVVGGHRPGAEIAAGADVGIADVGEVRDLRALADPRVLDLDEGARLGARLERGAGPEIGEGADLAAVEDLALDQVGVGHEDVRRRAGCRSGC